MLGWLKLLSPKFWIVLALVASTAGALGYTFYLGGEAPRTEVKRLKDLDDARLAAEGREAARLARNKERIDEENARRTAALDAELARLRSLAVLPLPPAPAGSSCPGGQVCFDRPQFDRARGEFYSEVRSIAGEGTKMSIDRDSAIESANGNP